jgi:hypothetical protein
LPPAGAPVAWVSGAWRLQDLRACRSPSRSALRCAAGFRPLQALWPWPASTPLLRPLLTSRPGSSPSPFQAQAEISPGKNRGLHRTVAGSTPPSFGRKSFAVFGPLALDDFALYPVLVHRPAASLPAAFSAGLAAGPTSRSASSPCGSLGSPRPGSRRTCTSTSRFMLGTPKGRAPRANTLGALLTPAASYSPTEFPLQYHRPWRA